MAELGAKGVFTGVCDIQEAILVLNESSSQSSEP